MMNPMQTPDQMYTDEIYQGTTVEQKPGIDKVDAGNNLPNIFKNGESKTVRDDYTDGNSEF